MTLAGQTVAVREKGLALAESFDDGNDTGWTAHAGSWSVTAGSAGYTYDQTTTAIGVSNAARPLSQLDAMTFEWTTTWTNDGIAQKGAGLHFFASSGSSLNHGNSYLVYQSDTSLIVYESVSNTLHQLGSATLAAANGETHTYRATYNPTTGGIAAWRDGTFVITVTDPSPLTSGSYVALRTYNGKVSYDNLRLTGVSATFSTLTYLYSDHLGSTSILADTGGVLVDRVRFYPFGGYRGSDSSLQTDRGFTGHKQNDEIGLVYMNARYYVPGIGRFASADTIVPDPQNPQSYNRYSYGGNNPVRFTDPSGHSLCEGTEENCELGAPQPTPLVNFTGEDWTDDEMTTVTAAAVQVGEALAGTINFTNEVLLRAGAIDSYRAVSGRDAFLSTFGGTVEFKRVAETCATCWGETQSATLIKVFSNATASNVANTSHFIVHELGHAFENAMEAASGAKLPRAELAATQEKNSDFPNRGASDQQSPWGFAGAVGAGPNRWQQSTSFDASEEFADMFIGWTYNRWDAGAAGDARANFMTTRMRAWTDLIVNAND